MKPFSRNHSNKAFSILLAIGLFALQSCSTTSNIAPNTPNKPKVKPEVPAPTSAPSEIPKTQPTGTTDAKVVQDCINLQAQIAKGTQPSVATCDQPSAFFKVNGLVKYELSNGDVKEFEAYTGRHVAFLIPNKSCSDEAMETLIKGLDKVWDFYLSAFDPIKPTYFKTYQNKNLIVVMPKTTCGGALCGYVGHTGVEVMEALAPGNYFTKICEKAKAGQIDQSILYEFGRNFTLFTKKNFSAENPAYVTFGYTMNTGFAIAMRFLSIQDTGLKGAPFEGVLNGIMATTEYDWFFKEIEALVKIYEDNPKYSISNTLESDKGVSSNYGASDLFASMMLKLDKTYGREFTKSFWKQLMLCDDAQSLSDAFDNIILAAARSTNQDVRELFIKKWRWPVTEKTKAKLAEISHDSNSK